MWIGEEQRKGVGRENGGCMWTCNNFIRHLILPMNTFFNFFYFGMYIQY